MRNLRRSSRTFIAGGGRDAASLRAGSPEVENSLGVRWGRTTSFERPANSLPSRRTRVGAKHRTRRLVSTKHCQGATAIVRILPSAYCILPSAPHPGGGLERGVTSNLRSGRMKAGQGVAAGLCFLPCLLPTAFYQSVAGEPAVSKPRASDARSYP